MDTEQPTIGPKPAGGFSGSPLQDAGKLYTYDSTGRIKEVRGTSGPLSDATYNADLLDPSARIGDYVIQKGQPTVVPNSPTDLAQRYKIAIGGTESPESGFNAKNEGLAVLAPVVAGASIGGPVGAAVGGVVGAIQGLMVYNTTREDALKRWQEQNVKYDTAVEFFRDDDGTLKYKLDYQKMGTGGPRSGEGIKEAQNRETQVSLGDDGHLKVTVSPIFASTAKFQEMVNYISKNYGGLSKDTENLSQILDEIKNGIDGEVKNYVTNMKLYADYAQKFPDASPETIIAGYTTEISGYIDPKDMEKYQVSILDGSSITTKSAKDFFDFVHQMDKGKRNEFVKNLYDIVYGDKEGYTDSQKAIAYGELQSLFIVSANTEKYENDKYQGMMDADPVVSFINDLAPLGLQAADVLSFLSGGAYSKQEYLTQDDFAGFLGGSVSIFASLGLWKGGTKLAEEALKRLPGSAQLFKASLEGQEGGVLAFFAQNRGNTGAVAKAATASAAFKTLKIGAFDAALAGVQNAVSDKDFWAEFGQDFARDAVLELLFSYYDMVQYQKAVNDSVVYVYKDPKTGDIKTLNTYQKQFFVNTPESETLVETPIYNEKGERVGGEWSVKKEGGITKYEPVGAINFQKTRSGDEVGIAASEYGTTYYYNGKVLNISPAGESPTLLSSGDIGIDEFPVLSSGVVETSTLSETDKIKIALSREGLSPDTEVFTMPSNTADSAIAASKIAKIQGTKIGAKVYENLFNRNGLLDMANNLALAKDGDLNAWRNAQEQFVSVVQNAQNNILDIQNGVYVKEAPKVWSDTLEIIGGFNYEYKYKPKTDGAYINAINQIQRAQLLNDSRVEGDTTDYVAKALEKYGEAINSMPQDRAEALQGWLEQGKKWIKVFNQSVKKSGKVDAKKLESFTDTDIEEKIGYFPVWAKKTTYRGLLDRFYGISQTRNPYKEWLRNGEWVPLDELEDPYTAMTRYMGFMANNMGLTDRNETAAKVLEREDLLVDNTPTTATVRKKKLESVKNKDELTKKLDEMVEAKKKEVEAKTLTPKQYSDAMTKIYEDSAIEETTAALALQTPGPTQPIVSDDRYKELIKKAKNYKTPERFEKMNDPIKGSEIWGEKPTSAFQLDDRGVRVDLFPNKAVKGTGITKQYLLNLFKDAYEQGVTRIFPSYGSYTKEGKSFMDHLAEQGWVKKLGYIGYEIAPKIAEWEKTSPLLDIYNAAHTPEAGTQLRTQKDSEQQWENFWKNAPAQTRKDIRNELEKTSLQTGYGISDTRARLNAQVPGADVLDWSLLGRDHTNGLVPGGLYTGKNSPVKAYIMSIDDLAKLAGYDLNNAIPGMGKVIEKHINIENAVPMLPAHIRGSGDGSEIWLKMRWGHNSDGIANWTDYLKTLKERGIEKIPVAIDDARGDYDTTFYRVRNTGIAQKGLDNIVEALDKAIATGKSPEFTVRDISAALHVPGWTREKLRNRILRSGARISGMEIQNAFDEADEYNWSEDEELNSLTDNIESVVEEKLGYAPQDITADVQQAFSEYGQIPLFRGQRGLGEFNMNDSLSSTSQVGDAYWIAPNASYTDEYGKDKIMGTIPVKYFMSDKEKNEIFKQASKEASGLIEKRYKFMKEKFLETFKDSKDLDESWFEMNWPTIILRGDKIEFEGKTFDSGKWLKKALTKKEKTKLEELSKFLWVPSGENGRFFLVQPDKVGREDIKSYRALAEYAKKPIIDTSEDGFAAGTAFFYYKGVDPEFDKEIGQQLATQALFDRQNPRWTDDEIANAMENYYDGMSLDEMVDNVTMGAGMGEDWDLDWEAFQKGELSSSDISEEFLDFTKEVARKTPGIAKVMQETWDNNTIQDLRDMKFRYWHPSTGYPTIDDDVAVQFLEDMGEKAPQGGESVQEGQASIWDAINPTSFANVPTEPQFKQPRRVTYDDYMMGVQADPDMAGRIQDSYRAALAQKLIREVTRVVGLAESYLSPYSLGMDWQSNLNTSIIPDLQNAINQRMLPDEFQSFVQARMVQAIQDVAPYQAPELILKSQLENVAQEWRDWATKHIKSSRFTQKELKEFVGSHSLDLPNDKRPYPSKVKHALWQMVQDGKSLPKIEGMPTRVSKKTAKEDFYKMLDETPLFQSIVKDKNELVDLVAMEKNGNTTDGYTMGVSAEALGLGGRYPITWYKNGKPYTRFIKYDTPESKRWAEGISALLTDKELVKEEGLISRFFAGAANDFRLLTTGWDPSRALPNLTRDTSRSFVVGPRFVNAKKTLQFVIDQGDYSDKQKEILKQAIENAANNATSSTYNSAYRSPKSKQIAITKEYLSKSSANPMKRFMYNLVHDKRSIAEAPMEFFEGYSRRNNARSLAAVQLGKDQVAGLSFEAQLKNAVDAANFAGREYTANFQRKGKLIGAVSKYVAYQSSAYAGLDGMLRAYIDNPKLVSRNFAMFVIAYLILLADTLSREKTRKQYYRLSEYDRENQIVISMGDSILTIPMDQELAGLLFPYRRIMETLNGTDPVSFFEFVWGTFTAWMPMDLSGFSEGDGFNLARGLEKLTVQNMPTALAPIQEAATGYDLYYGSDLSILDEDLRNRGIYSPKPGDYTTNGKDSLFLRNVANATGIPQWQLQAMWEGYGGNVGKYVLNIIDKAAGATKEQQGGKDFADTVFNSFTALDQDNAASVFYDGLKQLRQEKNALIQKIADYNEDLKVASGSAKVNLQNKIYEAKQEYAIKVGDFVDKYVSAYDITGGLPKSQAQQIYYLFRLDDDYTLYESGSPEEYYNNQAKQKFKNQATALSAPILDNYYNNRVGNIYQDADGVWRRYLSGGAQAMRNSIYGHGEQQMVDLLNILENKNTGLANLRSQVKKARSAAYEAGDWDTRDALGYEFDKKVIEAISPYIEHYGAENVLGNTQVLDYLADWFFVPNDFKRTKRGGYVSLAYNAQTDEAFVRPYIKYVFGLPTNYSSYTDTKFNSLELGE